MSGFVEVYNVLSDVYQRGSWIGEALKKHLPASSDKMAVRLVYSVVEREFLSEYRIARLTERVPKPALKILLKMGMCLIDEFDVPDHAAVNEITELTKKIGKGGASGFVNAVLRRYLIDGRELYPSDPDELLSVRSNRPLWLVKRYIAELGRSEAEKKLSAKHQVKTHIRPAFPFGKEALLAALSTRGVEYEETRYGFYVGDVGKLSDLFAEGKATVMSWSSLDVCANVPYHEGGILDLCAAPGGKSVFLAEKYGAEVTSCDLYPHRVELIAKYASRMKVNSVHPTLWDGRNLKEEWKDSFSLVLLDAPCSGFGSLSSNPDIILDRSEKDLTEIIRTQKELILAASQYVFSGGALVYATCSDLPSENEEVVRSLTDARKDYTIEKQNYTDITAGGGESYYFAILRKR